MTTTLSKVLFESHATAYSLTNAYWLAQLPQFGHRRVFFCPLRSRNPATD